MDGILIVDKPRGMTSHDVVRCVRRVFHTRKAGHAGTLDPMATGLLQIAIGRATRILEFLTAGDKTYRAVMKLGEITDTQDAEGKTLERRDAAGITNEDLERVCKSVEGDILQVPPMFSALKKNGTPLYKLARQGIEIEREARTVHIRSVRLQEVQLPLVALEIECSKGTYIRTLCHDMGLSLGTGAHLVELRRTRSGAFTEAEAIQLQELEALDPQRDPIPILSMEESLRGLPSREVTSLAGAGLANGIPPDYSATSGDPVKVGQIMALKSSGRLAAVARFDPSREREKRGDFELLKVFPGTS